MTHCKVNNNETAPTFCGYRGPYAKAPAAFARHWAASEQCSNCCRKARAAGAIDASTK